jgi:hypothetical protein
MGYYRGINLNTEISRLRVLPSAKLYIMDSPIARTERQSFISSRLCSHCKRFTSDILHNQFSNDFWHEEVDGLFYCTTTDTEIISKAPDCELCDAILGGVRLARRHVDHVVTVYFHEPENSTKNPSHGFLPGTREKEWQC